jgi:hypothetical protein
MMMQDTKTSFRRSKFPYSRERIPPKIIDNLVRALEEHHQQSKKQCSAA